jgi:hypothetical protein
MLFHFGRATAALGWLLTLAGMAYVVAGGRETLAGTEGSLPRLLVGLVAVVVGSSIIRWVKRAGTKR